MFVLDLYPSDICDVPLDIIPEVQHQGFPGIAVYDTTGVTGSCWSGIDIPSVSILTYPILIPSNNDRQIPSNAPYHQRRVDSQLQQHVLPLATPARQFSLQLPGETELLSEPSIVVRRGPRVAVFGKVWVLTVVVCGNGRVRLHYECWDDLVPVVMMIAQDIPRHPKIVGEYHLVEVE
jgi:hypothetical protein